MESYKILCVISKKLRTKTTVLPHFLAFTVQKKAYFSTFTFKPILSFKIKNLNHPHMKTFKTHKTLPFDITNDSNVLQNSRISIFKILFS